MVFQKLPTQKRTVALAAKRMPFLIYELETTQQVGGCGSRACVLRRAGCACSGVCNCGLDREKGDAMTPDTIITAEILEGLTKCPFCGAGVLHWTKSETTLECGTYLRLGIRSERNRGIGCYEQENDTLRARVNELEEALNQIANQDYRGNRSVESQIAYAVLKKGTQ